ncbi:replicative DNA helicase [Nocardioides sp. GY 10113]|nr:replicative DNA helicase [Nocardioides sp. GY 10113]
MRRPDFVTNSGGNTFSQFKAGVGREAGGISTGRSPGSAQRSCVSSTPLTRLSPRLVDNDLPPAGRCAVVSPPAFRFRGCVRPRVQAADPYRARFSPRLEDVARWRADSSAHARYGRRGRLAVSVTETGSRPWTDDPPEDFGDGPAPYAPGEAPQRPGDRTPPQDMAAEQSVLGAMLISKDAIADVVEVLRGVDYYRPAHEAIHEAILDLYGRGEPADMVTVAGELQRRGELQKIGGAPYLHTLAANVPIAANAGFYAQIVREKAILRRLVDAGTKVVQISYAGEGDVESIVNQAQAEIYSVTDRRKAEDFVPLSDIMDSVLDEIEAIENRVDGMYGVPTGFAELNDLTNGFHGGQMIIVAARPAVGKSTLALDFCRAASIGANMASVFFSLEMSRTEITMRLLSAEARIPLNHIRNGKMTTEEWERLARHVSKVSASPMFIDDSPGMTLTEIRAKARRLKQKHDLKLIVLDYLQLLTSGKKVESRQVEVSEFSRQIKLLAKELDVPIIALSQLNRGSEQRADKRPMTSDLRESGSIEQDADMVILLHRDDVYEKESTRPGEADLIIAKHRNGATRDIVVAFQGHYSRFVDMAH